MLTSSSRTNFCCTERGGRFAGNSLEDVVDEAVHDDHARLEMPVSLSGIFLTLYLHPFPFAFLLSLLSLFSFFVLVSDHISLRISKVISNIVYIHEHRLALNVVYIFSFKAN